MTDAVAAPKLLHTLTLYGKKWFYKGEGNANVILAVPEDGTVVRMMKDDGATVSEMAETLWTRVAFCDIVRRLFFSGGDCDYVDVPVPMSMSVEELREIDTRVLQDRPANRKHKSLGRTGSGLVAVCPDYTTTVWPRPASGAQRRVYCAEIKPKQGWSHEADKGMTNGKCAFCAHQYLKLSRGDVREISRYCPLDLFSGRRQRVKRAVRALLRSPQNNLKMFRDGVPLDGDDDNNDDFERAANEVLGDCNRFCAFVAAALLGDFSRRGTAIAENPPGPPEDGDGNNARRPCDYDAMPMSSHCVLHKVLTMQKMQTVGFATVLTAYERLDTAAHQQQQFGHVDRLLQWDGNGARVVTPTSVDGYLVAATARDCSVYVTFCETVDDGVWFDGHQYAVSVKVSDLDPKPLSTINKHRKRNADVLLAYQRYSQDRRK